MELQQIASSVRIDPEMWLLDGLRHLRENWGKYVRVYLTFIGVIVGGVVLLGCMGMGGSFVISVVAQGSSSVGGIAGAAFMLVMAVAYLAFMGAYFPLRIGFMKANQAILRGEDPPSNVILGELRNFIPALMLYFLIGVGTLLGGLLLLIPGLLFFFGCKFAPYIMAERGVGPVEAIRTSISMVMAQPLNIYLFGMAGQLILTLAGLIPIVGLLVVLVSPIFTITLSNIAYLRLSGSAGKMGDDGLLRNAGF